MTGASLPPSRPEPSPRMLALKIRRDYRRQRLARSFTDASFAASARHPTTPRTPLAASPRPTRSRPRPVPPPIRAAPWLQSLALFGGAGGCERSGGSEAAELRELERFGGAGDGKIRAPCMIRGVRAAKRAPSRQELRAMHSRKAVCGAFRIHGAHILPKPAHFEYTAAIYCHEGALFPSEAFFGIHRGKILPSSDTRERITSTYRHRQALGNAFRGHLAVAERPRAHCEHTLLCAGLRRIQFAGICRHARPPDDAPRPHLAN